MSRSKNFLHGMRDGFPIGMGYFAVAFSMGILAKKAGLTPAEGFLSSLLIRASAGEYGLYSLAAVNAAYIEVVMVSVITNLRYLLMNAALTQKFDPSLPLWKRLLVGVCCTDEIFGISIAYEGFIEPLYTIGATLVAGPMWATGTALGIIAGSILSARLVSALSVALYGMFLAVIIPAGKKDRAVLAAIAVSFLASWASRYLPLISQVSSGMRTILLTILIAAAAALIRPVREDDEKSDHTENEKEA